MSHPESHNTAAHTPTSSGPAQRAVVIGGGIAGLATAGLLAKQGYAVTLLEKNAHLGGRADEITVDGFRFETGPSWYLMPEAFDHFFALMGTSTARELDLQLLDPGYRVMTEGFAPLDVPQGKQTVTQLFESIEPGAGAALEQYLAQAADAYRISLERFLYTTFSSLGPLLHRDVLGRLIALGRLLTQSLRSFVEQRFSDVRLRQILQYPAVFLSTEPKAAPSLYHLMSHTDLELGVQYPQGGFSSIVHALARLAREHGVDIRTAAEATEIHTAQGRATGVRASIGGQDKNFAADIVVSAADLHHTETALLPPHLRSASSGHWRRHDPGVGVVLALLGVDGDLPQLAHHTLMFSREWDADFDVVFRGPHPDRPEGSSQSIYVCRPSATDATVAPAGKENLFVLIPVPADVALGHGDAYGEAENPQVRRIVDAAIAQIARWADIPDLSERIEVRRSIGPADFAQRYHSFSAGAIGPAHTLRQSAFLRGANVSKKVGNLYFAGQTTVPGVGVPMCLISAENVLKRVLGIRDSFPLKDVPVPGTGPTAR